MTMHDNMLLCITILIIYAFLLSFVNFGIHVSIFAYARKRTFVWLSYAKQSFRIQGKAQHINGPPNRIV